MLLPLRYPLFALLGFAAAEGLTADPAPSSADPPTVVANDNRHPAGSLTNGVLTLRLVAATARWYPETESGPHADVPVLSEEDGPPQIPAPLIRVPAGTTIDATIHNTLDSTIYMWGLSTKPAKAYDSIPILPGETRTIRFDAGGVGTYHYMASVGIPQFGVPSPKLRSEGQQMAGGFIVDPVGARIDDRVFVINIWSRRLDPAHRRNALAINGKSWPYTERISATVGDTLRWRVINASLRIHPMHMHGFYFRVDSRGTPIRDTVYTPEQRRIAATEDLTPGHSMSITVVPINPGNWLFHCHTTFHVVTEGRLDPSPEAEHELHIGDPGKHMSGLVLGINVRPNRGFRAASRINPRRLRLFVDEGRPRRHAPRALGFVLQQGKRPPAIDSVEIPGTTLFLTRGQPTDITITNRLKETTAIHWHGLELESYSDGVAGWSGIENHVAAAIMPGKSFTAHLTTPRAGTFIYHTHLNDVEQITSGLYGAIVVLEPGKRFDPKTDHVFLASWDGRETDPPHFLINGDTAAAPLELQAGVTHRLRLINIGAAGRVIFAIRKDSTLVQWRRVAKDGAQLPATAAVVTPALQRLGAGETFDAELTPPSSGDYTLTVTSPATTATYRRKIVVR